jgi:hypothetical protein
MFAAVGLAQSPPAQTSTTLAGKNITIKYSAPSNSLLAYATVYGNVGSSGAFVTNITTKPASSPRTDRVVACDNGTPTRCAYAYISIVTA